MNVLQILPELRVGGVERGTVDLAKHLVRLGHGAVVVSNGGALVSDLEALGARHYTLPVNVKNIFSMIRTVPLLCEVIEKEKIDIVHARSRVPAWIAWLACRRTGRILVTTCHGYYKKHFFSRVMGWGKRVIAPSNVIARHMIDDFNVPRDRIRLIPRSVDLEKFKYRDPRGRPGSRELHIGIIGRLTPLKGHLYFIKAMARVCKMFPEVKIWIVGDAPAEKDAYKEQIRVLVKWLGLWDNTEFLGSQKDIPDVLSHLDLLVLATTTQEAFVRVIVEAQAAGVPVVATAVGGVIDIIEDGKTGLLVPPADPQAMADAITRMIMEKEHAVEMVEEAYKKVKAKYSLDLMVKNTLEVYNEALQSRRVLVIKISSLGDVILTTAAVKALRRKFPRPHYKIAYLVGKESKELLLRCPYIDEVITCDFKNRDAGLSGLLKLSASLRARDFDITVDLQNNRSSHLLAALCLAPARYGYANAKLGFLLNRGIKDDVKGLDPVSHQFRVLKEMGIELQDPSLELWPGGSDETVVSEFLAANWITAGQGVVGVNIGASRRWRSKVWPRHQLARFCAEMVKKDLRVVLTGTAEDCREAEELERQLPQAKLVNTCGRFTVNQLACLIRKCSVYVSGDSAPLHVAAAVSTPFVALFGPTDPARHLPPAKQFVLIRKALPCSPCYKPDCKNVRCMDAISSEEVAQAVMKLMSVK